MQLAPFSHCFRSALAAFQSFIDSQPSTFCANLGNVSSHSSSILLEGRREKKAQAGVTILSRDPFGPSFQQKKIISKSVQKQKSSVFRIFRPFGQIIHPCNSKGCGAIYKQKEYKKGGSVTLRRNNEQPNNRWLTSIISKEKKGTTTII